MSNLEIMVAAKKSLKGKWLGEAGILFLFGVLLCLIYTPNIIIGSILGEESLIACILDLTWHIMLLPTSIGIAWYYNNLTQNYDPSIQDFFHGYSTFFRNLRACILKCVVITALIAIACIPLALCLFGDAFVILVSIMLTLFWGFYIFLNFFGTIVFYDWRISEDHKTGLFQILRDCYKRMQPHNDQFFMLNVRFTGWFILCICTLGIACFWILPYLYSSYGIFYHKYIYPVDDSSSSSSKICNLVDPTSSENPHEHDFSHNIAP